MPPARARDPLPKPAKRVRRVANARDIGPIAPASLWFDKASSFRFERKPIALFVDEGRSSVSEDDIWMLLQQSNTHLEIGLVVEVIVGSPFEQGCRRELKYSIEIGDGP